MAGFVGALTRIELAFPDRQSGPFARWGHGHWLGHWCARPGSNRHGLPPPSQDGASTSFATSANVWRTWSDSNRRCFRDGLRIRSLGRWGHRSMIGGSGWFRTTCARVKNPLHLHSGSTLRIHRLDGCGDQPRLCDGPPVMNRTSVDRLSSDCSATELREAIDGASGRLCPCHLRRVTAALS